MELHLVSQDNLSLTFHHFKRLQYPYNWTL